MMEGNVELMSMYWTTAGIYPGEGEISRFEFRDRVEAAARAGFKGIGIWHTDLEHIMVHRTLKEMRGILDDNGMKYLELEFLTDWFLDGGRRAESDGRRKRLLEASVALGAHHIKIGDFYHTPCSMPRAVDAFAALCREAEAHGTRIGFELMPSSMIDNLKDALLLVQTAGAANGGLILDIVHVVNIGITHEEISRIPPRHLVTLELNDGTVPTDSAGARKYCGEGEFDIRGFISCVRQTGYEGPWGVEVFSRSFTGLSVEELSRRAFQTAIAQFTE
jgi:sugar phosphate isomerase/epimerase